MTTATDIVNRAIALMGDNQQAVTGVAPNFDTSAAGKAAAVLYDGVVKTIARQHGWDFARQSVTLSASGNTPPVEWANEYLYPANGVQVWQLVPPTLADPNNPLPVTWAVGTAVVGSSVKRVIWSNLSLATARFNGNPADPSVWDPLFTEGVVRLLASEMAMAVAGKPATSQGLLESGAAFENLGEGRDS